MVTETLNRYELLEVLTMVAHSRLIEEKTTFSLAHRFLRLAFDCKDKQHIKLTVEEKN